MQKFQTWLTACILVSWITVVEGACNSTTCPANSDCVPLYPCKQGIECLCKRGYKLENNQCFLSNKKIGESCARSAECMPYLSSCFALVCRCPNNHTVSTDNTRCLKNKIGAACDGSNSCGINAYCSNSKCRCYTGYRNLDGTNCTHYVPGDTCLTSTECDSEDCQQGTCSSGTYQCFPGLKWYVTARVNQLIDGKCVPENAITDIGVGYYCESSSSDYYYCSANMQCGSCPEETNNRNYRCLSLTENSSDSTNASSSFVFFLVTLLLANYMLH